MAFQGDLFDFPLTDIFWFLENHKKSGWLMLTSRSTEIIFTFSRGQLVAARSGDLGQRIGARLVADGVLSEDQLREALDQQESSIPRPPLGRIFVQRGFVTREQLQRAISAQFGELVFRLLIKPTGQFRFDPGIPDMRGEPVNVSIQQEVFGAVRRADEWSANRLYEAPMKLNPSITPETLELLENDDAIVAQGLMSHGPQTLDQLVETSGRPRDEIAEHLTRLQASGVVYPDVQIAETDEIESNHLVA